MPRIARLHTDASHRAVFDAASQESRLSDVTLHHGVRPDLLAEAERNGGLTPDIAPKTSAPLRD